MGIGSLLQWPVPVSLKNPYIESIENPNFMGINKTGLHSTVADSELFKEIYQINRKDRPHGRGGDVLLFITNSFMSNKLYDLQCSSNIFYEFIVSEISNIVYSKIYIIHIGHQMLIATLM